MFRAKTSLASVGSFTGRSQPGLAGAPASPGEVGGCGLRPHWLGALGGASQWGALAPQLLVACPVRPPISCMPCFGVVAAEQLFSCMETRKSVILPADAQKICPSSERYI